MKKSVVKGKVANSDLRRLFKDGLGGRPLQNITFENRTREELNRIHTLEMQMHDGRYAKEVLQGERNIHPWHAESILSSLEQSIQYDSRSDMGYISQLLFFFLFASSHTKIVSKSILNKQMKSKMNSFFILI